MDAGAAVPNPATWLGCTSNDLHKDEGAAPWITCIKTNKEIFGPHLFPLPAVGSFQAVLPGKQADAPEAKNYLLCLRMATLVDAGTLAMGDLPKFLESDIGVALAKDNLSVVALKHDQVAYVPHGMLAIPLSILD